MLKLQVEGGNGWTKDMEEWGKGGWGGGAALKLRICTQAVELFWMLLGAGGRGLTEAGGNLVECPALGFRDFEVGEDEEEDEQDGEDHKHVWPTNLLWNERKTEKKGRAVRTVQADTVY